jgi:large subunit ribosomal protein L4
MASVDIKTQAGKKAGTAELVDSVFGVEPNIPVMHQVVTAQLAARRAGTHSTKTRSEVRGGGAKPWRQKGTGRARAGSSRMPNWRGGGIAHGPKPRDYSQKTPKKMVKLALRSALSDRASDGNVIVVDSWSFDSPSTKGAVAALAAVGAEGKVLIVLGDADATAWKSFRNLTNVHCLHVGELNTYDVLNNDIVVFTADTLPTGAEVSKDSGNSSAAVSSDDENEQAPVASSDEEE